MTALVPILATTMAPDASWAVTVAEDGTLRTWVNGVAAEIARARVRIDAGAPVAVTVSGDVVKVLCVAEGMLRLEEGAPGTWPRISTIPTPALVRALTFSPSGSVAVVACDDGTLRGFDLRTGEFAWTLTTGAPLVRAVAMASDSGPVVAAFADGNIRRYDVEAGTSDIMGARRPAHAVAITPDGAVVVTAGADGILFRWDSRTGALHETRTLATAITAVAVNGAGDQVPVGGGDGRVWLHYLPGGPSVEYIVPADAPSGAVAAVPPQPRPRRVVDEDVRFTVYRPQVLSPGRWASMLVFAHKTGPVMEPGRMPVDPTEQVEARARAHFGGAAVRPVGADARHGLARGARLRIVPDLPGILCNPADAEVEWWEPVHEVMFRLLAGPDLAGAVVRGAVRIWCGPLILGEVSIAVPVAASGPAAESPPTAESVPRFRRIFPSYSHRDGAVVQNFAEAARALGDQYLQDVLTLRAGEHWDTRLLELIEDADVFQLFWSNNSMCSPHCRDEWEHALALQRPWFIRPIYWEEPLPEDPEQELPPAALRALHFVKVPVAEPYPAQPLPPDARDAPAARVFAAPPPMGTDKERSNSRRPIFVTLVTTTAVGVALVAFATLGRISHPGGTRSSSPPVSVSASPPASSPATAGTAKITGLPDGSRVTFRQVVTGSVSGIPSSIDIWLVVQPAGEFGYWPQPGPIQADPNGRFRAVAIFGPSASENAGSLFILMIVGASREASQRFRDFISTPPRAGGLRTLPYGTRILAQITVRRL